jgi:hypothetical protein
MPDDASTDDRGEVHVLCQAAAVFFIRQDIRGQRQSTPRQYRDHALLSEGTDQTVEGHGREMADDRAQVQTEAPVCSQESIADALIPVNGNCNGPQTRSLGLANKGDCEPTLRANMRGLQPTISAHEPRFTATSSPPAMWTQIQCIQHQEDLNVRGKSGSQLIWTHSVRFIGGYPDINVWAKGRFSRTLRGRGDEGTARSGWGDLQAIRRGPDAVAKRLARRAAGRMTGRMLGKLFR